MTRADGLQASTYGRGTSAFEGSGLEGRQADSVAVLARAVKVNAGLWANDLILRTGANEVDADTCEARRIEGRGDIPEFALDISAVGGMYAGRIFMVGTEKGLGVNLAGTLSATQAVSLDAAGNLKVTGTLYSGGSADLAAASVDNERIIAAGEDLSVTAESGIRNQSAMARASTKRAVLRRAARCFLGQRP